MKKLLFLAAGFAVMTQVVFALEFSVGAGLEFSDAITMVKETPNDDHDKTANSVVNGFGAFLFLDATYGELDVSFSGQSGAFPLGNGYNSDKSYPVSTTSFGFALLGKYPIKTGSFTFFPIFGVDYKIVLAAKNIYGDDIKDGDKSKSGSGRGVVYRGSSNWENGKLSDFSNLWLKAGVGGDFNLKNSVYIRGEYLYGLQIVNIAQTKSFDYSGDSKKEVVGITNGMTFKLVVGYRLGGTKSAN
jgi:hypothetical protein